MTKSIHAQAEHTRTIAQAGSIGVVGLFVIMSLLAACLAWAHQLEQGAPQHKEVCATW